MLVPGQTSSQEHTYPFPFPEEQEMVRHAPRTRRYTPFQVGYVHRRQQTRDTETSGVHYAPANGETV